jgi:hypothetical protein
VAQHRKRKFSSRGRLFNRAINKLNWQLTIDNSQLLANYAA